MKDYCNICIHQSVCMFKSHYEDAEQMYQQIREKCSKYPFFGVYIECTEFCPTRQLGLWTDNQNGTFTCSNCGCKHSKSNYCPQCGYEMEVEE